MSQVTRKFNKNWVKASAFCFLLVFASACGDSKVTPQENLPPEVVNPQPDPGAVVKKDIHQTIGLTNYGNNCYANSVHKLLWGWSDPWLQESSINLMNPKQKLFFSLINNLKKNWKQVDTKTGETQATNKTVQSSDYFASEIKEIFAKNGRFDWKMQEDAEEYLTFLGDQLDLPQLGGGFYISSKLFFENGVESGLSLGRTQDFFLQLPVTSVSENIQDFPSEQAARNSIPNDANPRISNIPSAIEEFFKGEKLHDPENLAVLPGTEVEGVPNSGTHMRAEKKLYLTLVNPQGVRQSAPRQVIVQLKRFLNKKVRVNGKIHYISGKFKETVNVTDNILLNFYSPGNLSAPEEIKFYTLKGVVIHQGEMGGGHYYSYILHDKTWVKHDDTQVTIMQSEKQLRLMHTEMNQRGYLFLYQE